VKGYTATRFLRELRTKNWTRAQILTLLKRTVIQTYTPCPGKNAPPKQNDVKCTVYNTIQ